MKKLTKHLSAIAMAFAIVLTTIIPVTVEAKPSYEEKFTAYRYNSNISTPRYTWFYVENLSKSDTIKKSSVKSSNTKSVKINYITKNYSGYETDYISPSYKHDSSSHNYCIGLSLFKPGKSTISFKIGNKGYKTVVNVAKYENPLATAKILGKNYASKLKSENSYDGIKSKSTQKNQTFTFEANKNWKISSVEFYKYKKLNKNSYSTIYEQSWSYYDSPQNKAVCRVGTIEKGQFYEVGLTLTNTKTGGTMYTGFIINYPYNY